DAVSCTSISRAAAALRAGLLLVVLLVLLVLVVLAGEFAQLLTGLACGVLSLLLGVVELVSESHRTFLSADMRHWPGARSRWPLHSESRRTTCSGCQHNSALSTCEPFEV